MVQLLRLPATTSFTVPSARSAVGVVALLVMSTGMYAGMHVFYGGCLEMSNQS